MKTLLDLSRYSLSACLGVAMLAGCGGSQLGSASLLPSARTVGSNATHAAFPLCSAVSRQCGPAIHTQGIDPPDSAHSTIPPRCEAVRCTLRVNRHQAQSDSARSTVNQCKPTATVRCIVAKKTSTTT